MHHAGLRAVRIEIRDDHDSIAEIVGPLAVAEQLLGRVVDRMKLDIGVALQCRIAAANSVQLADQTAQAVGPIDRPRAQFVFLRIEIFFAARLDRLRFRTAQTPDRRFRNSPRASRPEPIA